MATGRQVQRSPRLVLYGIAFRILCGLAVRPVDGKAAPAPRQHEAHLPRRKERRPLQSHPSVRAKLDAGR